MSKSMEKGEWNRREERRGGRREEKCVGKRKKIAE